MITMAICVWSAVHLNVPGRPPQDKWERLSHQLRRTRWTVMGLLAPELVVYCAWVQWSDARKLSRRIADAKYTLKHKRKHTWTLAHSFFAGMGGFAVDSSDFVPGQDHLYLTTAGAQRLVELGYQLPDLHLEAIADRSKADSLGKILVCLQAGYMIFQVVGRLVARLPITLLEVNTLGHVLCALTMYAFWFHKPLGVHDPVLLSEDLAKPLMSLWFMKDGKRKDILDCSRPTHDPKSYRELDLLVHFAHRGPRGQAEHDSDTVKLLPLAASDQAGSSSELSPRTRIEEDSAASHKSENFTDLNVGWDTPTRARLIVKQNLPEDVDGLAEHCILFYKHSESSAALTDEDILQSLRTSKLWDDLTHVYHCDTQDQFKLWTKQWCDQIAPKVRFVNDSPLATRKYVSIFRKSGTSAFLPQHIFLDSAGLRRWELAHRGLELDPDAPQYVKNVLTGHDYGIDTNAWKKGFVTRRVDNWPSPEAGMVSRGNTPAWVMAVVTALYGALHALCWNSHFPSIAEKMLWRISSLIIAGGPLTGTALFYGWIGASACIGIGTFWDIWVFVGVITALLSGLVYVGARLFILTEAFVSLRSLPDAAYQTPNWTTWLPHL